MKMRRESDPYSPTPNGGMEVTRSNCLCALVFVGMMVLAAFPAMLGPGTVNGNASPTSRACPINNGDCEPNDAMTNASELDGTVTPIYGAVSGSDIWDWYKFNLTNTAGTADRWNITIDWDKRDGSGTKTETGMSARLLNPFGLVLDFERDMNMTYLNVAAGIGGTHLYYLNITNDMGSGQTEPMNYTLIINKGTLTTIDNDNDPDNATMMGTFPYEANATVDGSDGPTDYEDFYKTTVSATTLARDLLTVFVKPAPAVAIRVEILRENGPTWDLVDKLIEDPAQPGKNQTATYAASGPGTVLVRVRNTNTALGSYHIFVNRIPVAQQDCNFSNATPLQFAPGNTHIGGGSGSLGEGIHSCDWFSFTAKNDRYMYVNLTSKDYSGYTELPVIVVSLFDTYDAVNEIYIEYKYEQSDNPRMNPTGHVSGYATADNKNNYIRIEIMKGGGAGAYNFSFMTDNRPINKTSLVVPFDIKENGQDSSIKIKDVFSDPDGDPMTFDWWIESEAGMNDTKNFTVAVATDPNMTVTLKPRPGNATDPFGWKGSGSFCARATDNYGLNDTVCWAIRVVGENHEPMLKNATMAPVSLKADSKDPSQMRNDSIDLDDYFMDPDNEKLQFTAEGDGVNLSYDRVGTVIFLKKILVNASTPENPDGFEIFTITFGLETNRWQHTGRLFIELPEKPPDWTGEVVLTFFALDASGERSVEGQNLSIRITKTEGTAPKWQTFDLKWYEDQSLVKDIIGEKLVTDVDLPNDKLSLSFVPAAPGNVTIETGDCDGTTKCMFRFKSAPNWYGDVPIVINATDKFNKTSETKDMKFVVMPVDDPPVLNWTLPATHDATVNEASTIDFRADVTDVDTAQGDLRYEWTFDGELLRTATGPEYSWTPSAQHARDTPYKIGVKVTYAGWNGSLSWDWNVTVLNVNMPPKIGSIIEPTENQTFKKGEIIDLSCTEATDQDGDAITYTWFVDDGEVPQKGTSVTFDTGGLEPGNHTLKLVISDGVNPDASTTMSFNITKKKNKPTPGFEAPLVAFALLAAAAIAVTVVGRRRRT